MRLVWTLCLMLLATPTAAQNAWEMPTEYPASAIPGEGLATFARLVNEKSGDRLVIRPSYDAAKGVKSRR